MFSDRLLFEPPMVVKNNFYRCDSKFYLDDILHMYTDDHKINGVVFTDGEICTWYTLINENLKKIASENIHLQNQFKNGGQSSNRLARNRDIQRDQYLTSLAEKTVSIFYDKQCNKQKVSNIIFCGPAEFKKELFDHKLISTCLKNIYVVTMANICYQTIIDIITKLDDSDEIDILNQIKNMICIVDDKLVFGDDVCEMINMKLINVLYVHHEIDLDSLGIINDYGFKIIKLKSNMIKDYGSMIGVKFY